jgi:uncharacterized protein (UPF0261 family)
MPVAPERCGGERRDERQECRAIARFIGETLNTSPPHSVQFVLIPT